MISEVASHSAWLDLANTPAQWQMEEAQVRKIVAGLSTTTPTLHWTSDELAGFLGDAPRRHVGQWIDAALVMGTFEWRLTTTSPTWRSPCMVGAVRLTPSPSGGWTGTLVGNVTPNRALRQALLAVAQSPYQANHSSDSAGQTPDGGDDAALGYVGIKRK